MTREGQAVSYSDMQTVDRSMWSVAIHQQNQSELLRFMSQSLRNGLMRGPGGHKESTMHEYGDCSFCGGEVREEFVELDYRYKKQLYIFRDVPTGVCQQCGKNIS
jgi:YgiT-type zinc finger domain-containing protein